MQVVETDLGEYILQLAKEPPSHIIAPVIHKGREEIADLFAEKHHLQVSCDSLGARARTEYAWEMSFTMCTTVNFYENAAPASGANDYPKHGSGNPSTDFCRTACLV